MNKWAAMPVALVAVFFAGYWAGNSKSEIAHAKEDAAAASQAATTSTAEAVRMANLSVNASVSYQAEAREVIVAGETIIKEVPASVTSVDCAVSLADMRVLDSVAEAANR